MNIQDVLITPLSVIETVGGNVSHAIKCTDNGYSGFGEAYLSIVNTNAIKGWKRHNEMVLNLVVVIGKVKFVLFDDRLESVTNGNFQEVIVSQHTPLRITVPKLLWVAFQGLSDENIILNVANIEHDVNEVDRKNLNEIDFQWNNNT